MGQFSEQIKAFLNSPQAEDAIKQYNDHIEHCKKINEKYVKKFNDFSKEKKIEILNKLMNKYNSNEYQDRYYNKGQYPTFNLYDRLEEWCANYNCPKVLQLNPEDNWIGYDILEGEFLFECLYDFSSNYSLKKCKKGVVIPHDFTEPLPSEYHLINNHGKCICVTTSKLTIMDCLNQIRKQKLGGYVLKYEGAEYPIKNNGLINDKTFYLNLIK